VEFCHGQETIKSEREAARDPPPSWPSYLWVLSLAIPITNMAFREIVEMVGDAEVIDVAAPSQPA
jgi:hypothetical protein